MKPRDRFAPLSGGPSSLLDAAAGYFMLSGALNVFLAAMLLVMASRGSILASWSGVGLVLAIRLAVAAGFFWTALLLMRGARRGGFLALAFSVLPVVPMLFGSPMDGLMIFWTILSLTVLASIWRNLS